METKNISRKNEEIEKFLKKGYEEIEAKRWDYALIVFEKVLTLDENSDEAILGILETHRAHANDELKKQHWDKAIEVSDTILSLADNIPLPYKIRILAKSKKTELDNEIFLDLFFAIVDKNSVVNQNLLDDYKNLLQHSDPKFNELIIENAKEAIYSYVCELLDKGDIESASPLLRYIKSYKDINEKYAAANYAYACKFADSEKEANQASFEDLTRAKNILKLLEKYKDSAEKHNKIAYRLACRLASENNFVEAQVAFEEIREYEDAGNRAYLCESYISLENSAKRSHAQYQSQIEELQKRKTALTENFEETKKKKKTDKKKAGGWWLALLPAIYLILLLINSISIYLERNLLPIEKEISLPSILKSLCQIMTLLFSSDSTQPLFGEPYELVVCIFLLVAIIALVLTFKHPKHLFVFIPFAIISFIAFLSYGSLYNINMENDNALFAIIVIMNYVPFFVTICSVMKILGTWIGNIKSANRNRRKRKEISKELKDISQQQVELQDKLTYYIETMIGDEVETFESEAEGIGFMQGYGKALIEKYSKI